MAIGLYIHVPFCVRKCLYCDFISYPLEEQQAEAYIKGITTEISLYKTQLSPEQQEVATIFIGGGTPTCLKPAYIEEMMKAVYQNFKVAPGVEITMEGNPGTVSLDNLRDYRSLGINRLSLGAQAFQDELLKGIGRVHLVKDIGKSVENARKAGFDNLNLDLMFALPGQTMNQWQESLQEAVGLGIEHISAYGLKIEEGTPFAKFYEEGKIQGFDEDLELGMMEKTIEYLSIHGYGHYEISNYAKPNHESRHNLIYWRNQEYLGLGPGAYSRMGNQRFSNYATINQYTESLRSGQVPVEERENLSKETQMSETIFLALRLREGLNTKTFEIRFGVKLEELFANTIEKFQKQGMLQYEGNHLKLTPRALPVANMIFAEFLI